jgi:hypothetical protein
MAGFDPPFLYEWRFPLGGGNDTFAKVEKMLFERSENRKEPSVLLPAVL